MAYINQSNKYNRTIMPALSVTVLLWLSGCQSHEPETVSNVTPAPQQHSNSTPLSSAQIAPAEASLTDPAINTDTPSSGTATVCQHELAALSKINPAKYAAQKAIFDNLLKSASLYSTVREDVNAQTKDTMDTLYKYKTQKICNDIEQAIHESLVSRGESVK